jgi:hypothetical protein
MRTRLRHPKSLSLKILRVSPYNSEILMRSRLQVHCFHRPGGRGYPPRTRKPQPPARGPSKSSFGSIGQFFSQNEVSRGSFPFWSPPVRLYLVAPSKWLLALDQPLTSALKTSPAEWVPSRASYIMPSNVCNLLAIASCVRRHVSAYWSSWQKRRNQVRSKPAWFQASLPTLSLLSIAVFSTTRLHWRGRWRTWKLPSCARTQT